MKMFINSWKLKKRKLLANLIKKHGSLPAKGFPGRAAILIKLLSLDKKHLRCVHEQDMSNKVGHYVPGTKIPIVPDKLLKKINRKTPILNLAWHIKVEIKKYLIKKNIRNKVIEVLENKDF